MYELYVWDNKCHRAENLDFEALLNWVYNFRMPVVFQNLSISLKYVTNAVAALIQAIVTCSDRDPYW